MTKPGQHLAHTVLHELVDRYESSTAFVRGEPTTRRIQIAMNDRIIPGYTSGGMDADIRRQLHETLLLWRETGVINIEWARFEQGNLLRRVLLSWDAIAQAYELLGRTPKGDLLQSVETELVSYADTLTWPWMQQWMADVRRDLTDRKSIPDALLPADETRRRLLLQSLAGLCAKGDEVLSMRVFSKRYLKNSKRFEREIRSRFTSLLRQYATVDDTSLQEAGELTDSDAILLAEVGIEVTHQEISFCGPIVFEQDGAESQQIDCTLFPRGLALDSDVLADMKIVTLPVDRILTIENKANYRHYIRHECKRDELVIYLGGFPSPVMRQFMRRAWQAAQNENTAVGKPITFAHWGDLDYGGILITQVLRNTVTREFQTWRMEPEWLDKMAAYVEPFEEAYRTRLEGLLGDERYLAWRPLLRKLLEVGGTLEQEAFLV